MSRRGDRRGRLASRSRFGRLTIYTAVTVLAAVGLVAGGSQALASSTHAEKGRSSWSNRAYTQVSVAPGTLAALTSLGVRPGVVAPARLASADPLAVRFPITRIALPSLVIKHRGGITLTAGTTKVTLSNFWIDLRRQVVSGKVAGVGRVDLFKLTLSTSARPGPARLTLTSTAAGALNGAFGVSAFREDLLFGQASFKPASFRRAH